MKLEKVPTICLSMILRDEAHIIRRCLDSVKPYIDRWVVCDTGSIDDTCVLTRSIMADIPGEVVHHPWKDFGHNRTLALQEAAKQNCDYILVIDADEVLVVDDPRCLQALEKDAYRIEMQFPTISYPRVNLMRSARGFRYEGRIHEYATCDPPAEEWLLDPKQIHMWTDGDGARGRSGTKLQRDCDGLAKWNEEEPGNPRTVFYLAQAYETVNNVPKALEAYAQRVTMGDYIEEVWYSYYRMGQLHELQQHVSAAQHNYLQAYECQPQRAEPLVRLALLHHNKQQDHLALLYLEQATCIDKPISALFVEPAMYDYVRWVHYIICLHNCGKHDEARETAQQFLAASKVPPQYLPMVQRIAGIEPKPALEAAHGTV